MKSEHTHALWQRQWLTGQLFEEQLHYWKQQLDGAPTVLELPADRRRPARPAFQGTRELVHLPLSLTQALHTWSQQEGVTLFMTLLAAWSILLYRYSGQEDILIGSPVANRVRPELEGLIGFFVNTLVLRSNLSGDPTVRQLVQRMGEVALGAFAHQDFPFEQLVEELHLERDLSRTVLIQAVFAWQNTPLPPLEIAGLSLKPIEIDTGTAKFDLLLALEDTEQGIQGMLEYNTDVF
jgi:non-ribosomal peptide synthetase component F